LGFDFGHFGAKKVTETLVKKRAILWSNALKTVSLAGRERERERENGKYRNTISNRTQQ